MINFLSKKQLKKTNELNEFINDTKAGVEKIEGYDRDKHGPKKLKIVKNKNDV